MKKRAKTDKLARFFRFLYLKLFRINDSPQRIALGLGLGVFLGIMPGTGPLAALFLAFLLPVNRAAIILGSLLTNTWLSIVTFFLAVKIGASALNLKWEAVYADWLAFLRHLTWKNLLRAGVWETILPVFLGYIIVAFAAGFMVYLMAAAALKLKKR
jgi:uncharacterized protein (DUF2062 family)